MCFTQKRKIKNLVTLPKKMLPLRLQLFKQLLLMGSKGLQPAAAVAALEAPPRIGSIGNVLSFPRSRCQPRRVSRLIVCIPYLFLHRGCTKLAFWLLRSAAPTNEVNYRVKILRQTTDDWSRCVLQQHRILCIHMQRWKAECA